MPSMALRRVELDNPFIAALGGHFEFFVGAVQLWVSNRAGSRTRGLGGRLAGEGDSIGVRIPESTHWIAVPGGGVQGATPVTHIRIGAAANGKYLVQFDAAGEFVAVEGIGTGPGGSAHINRIKRSRAGASCSWELRWNPGDKQHEPSIEMKRFRSIARR